MHIQGKRAGGWMGWVKGGGIRAWLKGCESNYGEGFGKRFEVRSLSFGVGWCCCFLLNLRVLQY